MRLQSIFGYFGVRDGGTRRRSDSLDSITKGGPPSDEPPPSERGPILPEAPKVQAPATLTVVETVAPLGLEDLEAAMQQVSDDVTHWSNAGCVSVRNLQDAIRNHGRVDLMRCTKDGDRMVAVKRMPNKWVRNGPKEFAEQYPTASEKPWGDIGLLRKLNTVGFPYVCDLAGVYRSNEETFVVTSFCTEGDLFAWCDRENVPRPGRDREKTMLPIVTQIFTAVRWLHELGIAHRDLSLENILLTDVGGGELHVKVIDFGMATLSQTCRREVRGKQSYQAPEMHTEAEYDTFLGDAFAIGVVLFAMAAQDYPWTCTKRNSCQLFEYVSMFGLRRFLEKRKLRKGNGEYLLDVFSPAFTEIIEAMLQTQPKQRACFGEHCLSEQVTGKPRRNIWEMKWLEGVGSPNASMPPFAPRTVTTPDGTSRIAGG
mmetsp:Transcript_16415/g.41770  ORF Transcript_16415/g.41770 Transcript_16415/m.41770 type:complete len:427 (-) Transcript_16415:194-1474(-)